MSCSASRLRRGEQLAEPLDPDDADRREVHAAERVDVPVFGDDRCPGGDRAVGKRVAVRVARGQEVLVTDDTLDGPAGVAVRMPRT